MSFRSLAILVLVLAAPVASAQRIPLQADFLRSLSYAHLGKTVYASQTVHDMEDMTGWTAGGVAQIEHTTDHAVQGRGALRFYAKMRDEELIRAQPGSRMMGQATAILTFDQPQDWTAFNRLSLWAYIHPSPVPVHTFYLRITTEGVERSILEPHYDHVAQELTAGQWNRILWEIPHLRRDKVTEFRIVKLATGQGGMQVEEVVYDFDHLELQRVYAEKFEGWDVAPGKLAYSHVGFRPDFPKQIYASGLDADVFQVRDAATGDVVWTAPVKEVDGPKGVFQVLDFSALDTPGEFVAAAGPLATRPFSIADTVWLPPVRKALNFFRVQRCGQDVPGVHAACHLDVQGSRGDVLKPIWGGWHDAGDLSQGSFRTAHAAYAMLELAEGLRERSLEPALEEHILQEARWGLDWLLKTRFGDGYRITWNSVGIYTDNRIGTPDDIIRPAQNIAWENFGTAAVEALGARTWRERDPDYAAQLLEAAREDWEAAVRRQGGWLDSATVGEASSHRAVSDGVYLALSWGILASAHLHAATGEASYLEKAVEYGKQLLRCQEMRFPERIPFAGYWYTNPDRKAILNHRHAAFEETPLLALQALIEALPEHEDWMSWYGAAFLYTEHYLEPASSYAAPYDVLPNAVFRRSDIEAVPDSTVRAAMMKQFEEGTRLSENYRLRFFPVWTTPTHHGNTAVLLSQNVALAAASEVRRDLGAIHLAEKQMQWVFGANPFSQSQMYGEGYDFPMIYAYNEGDVVGSLPVGMDCMRNDEPFWSQSNHSTFKEVWVVPVARFLWNVAHFGLPGEPVPLPGEVTEETGGMRFTVEATPIGSGRDRVRVTVTAEGAGRHAVALRLFNGRVRGASKNLTLREGRTQVVTWDVQIADPASPWVGVVVPDGDLDKRVEVGG